MQTVSKLGWYKYGDDKPCSPEDYFAWHEAMPDSSDWYKSKTGGGFSVSRDEVSDGREVSTVYLGFNHAFDDGSPVLWETMVFPGCDICERYHTLEEALEGHRRIMEECA